MKIDHFAHVPPWSCAYGQWESEGHRRAKLEIHKALSANPLISDLTLEDYGLGDVRPDLSFTVEQHRVAVEVQISTLPLDTIIARTVSYTRKGIYLLWISPYDTHPLLQTACQTDVPYSPRVWERYIHALYFGRVFYWVFGQTLWAIAFNSHYLSKESTPWGGGYTYTSKRFRKPAFLAHVEIAGLHPTLRKPGQFGRFHLPAARLWTTPFDTESRR